MNSFYYNNMLSILRANANKHHFKLLDEKVGFLIIYNKINFNPLCILIESWNKTGNITNEENDACGIAKYLSKTLNIPFYFISYSDDTLNHQSEITYYTSNDLGKIYKGKLGDFFTKLTNEYLEFRVISMEKYVKPINDKSSTPFHVWQRKYLKYIDLFYDDPNNDNIKMVDVDMVYCDTKVRSIIEIKRSYVSDWKPYKADENNYLSICKFCDLLGINFFLFFVPQNNNNGVKIDDYEHIKIYDMYHRIGGYNDSNGLIFKERCVISLNELMIKEFNFFLNPLPNDTWTENKWSYK